MLAVVGRIVLAGVLVVAVIAKLRDPRASAAAMATYGFRAPRSQWGALALIVAIESALAVGVALGADEAAYAAAGLMLLLAATQVSAVLAGRAGAPCACFGARSKVGPASIARNLALAVGFAALPALTGGALSTDEWLALGLAVGPGRVHVTRLPCLRGPRAGRGCGCDHRGRDRDGEGDVQQPGSAGERPGDRRAPAGGPPRDFITLIEGGVGLQLLRVPR